MSTSFKPWEIVYISDKSEQDAILNKIEAKYVSEGMSPHFYRYCYQVIRLDWKNNANGEHPAYYIVKKESECPHCHKMIPTIFS